MEQDAALRGQTARASGLEMESFPHCPLRGLRNPSPSGELPSLATPQFAANETLDSAALTFLLNRALEEKKEEEERKKREEEQRKVMEEEKKAKKALAAWTARRKAVTDEMHALLDVWRLTPAQREREVELIRELDVIDAAMPPSLPKRRRRKKRSKRTRRRP